MSHESPQYPKEWESPPFRVGSSQTYDIRLIPAERLADGQVVALPNAQTGWITVVTTK